MPTPIPVLAVLALGSAAAAATPDYTGTICPDQDGARIEVQTDPDTTLMVIFPTPPGSGGWGMTQEAPGLFSHVISGVSPGDSLSFSLLLQNPLQYTYPEHTATLGVSCSAFERDDVTPPPARGFRHDLELRSSEPWFTFQSGQADFGIADTTAVEVTWRIDGGEFTTATLIEVEPGQWETPITGGASGQSIEYWFSQLIGIQTMHTALHTRVIGQAAAEVAWPIITTQTGRFHHRHPNEWRFDNYVEQYGEGRTFEMVMTDWGNRLDMVVTIDRGLEVGSMDFKYFVENDPYSATCNRPLSVVNTKMVKSDNVFTGSIEDTTPGAIIDFDFAFVDLPADNPVSIYYSNFYYYRAGHGLFGPETPNPRAVSVGGATTPNVYSPRFGFAQHAPSISQDDLKGFLAGKLFFETDFTTGDLLNVSTYFDCCAGPIGQPLDASPVHRAGILGPRQNTASCILCHAFDGRGSTPYEGEDLLSLVAQISVPGTDEHGGPLPHPLYGSQFSPDSSDGGSAEGRLHVTYEEQIGFFDDGSSYSLRVPTYVFKDMAYGSIGTNILDEHSTPGYNGIAEFSPRIAPMIPGLGMLEAVADETILSMEDPNDANGDGISGRVNMVWDERAQTTTLGRFGWKANQPSLRQQAAGAYLQDMGITSSLFPTHDCGDEQDDCEATTGPPEIDADELDDITSYLRGLTLPPRRNFDDPNAIAGMHLFKQANCQACHTPTLHTSSDYPVVAYRNKTIEPFTDMLLHDMGDGLADGRPHFEATGSEWRTPPLWGLSYVQHVLGVPATCEDPSSGGAEPNFMHDGRARSLMEAILWHGGEAESSRNAVLAMSATQRDQLIAYVGYPFADAIFDGDSPTTCLGDLNGDGQIGLDDLLQLLSRWGESGAADLDGNGTVNSDDLTHMLSRWGGC